MPCSGEDDDPHRHAEEGEAVRQVLEMEIDQDIGGDGDHQDQGDDPHPGPIHSGPFRHLPHDRLIAMLLDGGGDAKDHQGHARRHIGVQDVQGGNPGDPHHGRGRVPHHAAGTAGIGGGDDGGQKADVDPVAEDPGGNGAADEGGGNVVQEAGQHENHDEQHKAAEPALRQKTRQELGDVAVLEMAG